MRHARGARPRAIASATLALASWACADRPAVDPRLEEATAWYTGVAGRVDDDRARALLLEAAADGDPVSRMWVARCHSRGRMGFEENPEEARRIAAEVIDDVEALAAGGVAEAVFLMGTAYDEGIGKARDMTAAVSWYRRAAELGNVLAAHNMGNVYFEGRGVAQSDSAAVSWWTRAAERGDAIPQLRLGTMHEEGRGVARDLEAAARWYRRAAEAGNADARAALERLGR